jgi:hypothetical protein
MRDAWRDREPIAVMLCLARTPKKRGCLIELCVLSASCQESLAQYRTHMVQ